MVNWELIGGSLSLIFMAIISLLLLKSVIKARNTTYWPYVTGTFTKRTVAYQGKGSSNSNWEMEVEYEVEIQGKEYTGTKISPGFVVQSFATKERASRKLDELFPPDTVIKV